jgi:hypothetical protein
MYLNKRSSDVPRGKLVTCAIPIFSLTAMNFDFDVMFYVESQSQVSQLICSKNFVQASVFRAQTRVGIAEFTSLTVQRTALNFLHFLK